MSQLAKLVIQKNISKVLRKNQVTLAENSKFNLFMIKALITHMIIRLII